jgi:hypothetical protein
LAAERVDNMDIRFNRRGQYFSTNYCFDENGNKIGAIETHDTGVKTTYYVAWIFFKNPKVLGEGKTESFKTWDECVKHIEENNQYK